MERKRSQNPAPFKTERVGHPEKPNQSLGVDVQEWYHLNVIRRQEEIGEGWATREMASLGSIQSAIQGLDIS